ncbi:TetR/AcrR family transcriptional regulator [Variovorax sp. KK3]|nr:TetR/AcrR family transcriptional regulator [Variovorax sp. KK3]
MLEAAMQLLDQEDPNAMTTNAVAVRAGVSIGSVYQYFKDKQAMLDALSAREIGALADNVLKALNTPPVVAGDRIRGVVRAVRGAYGGRGLVHRRLIEYALTHYGTGRLSPLYTTLIQACGPNGQLSSGEHAIQLSEAQAFVLTHALAGVLRTQAASVTAPSAQEVEDAVVLLALGFVEAAKQRGTARATATGGDNTDADARTP